GGRIWRLPTDPPARASDHRGLRRKTATTAGRIASAVAAATSMAFAASPALAEEAASKIDAADTAWMISASALVLMMTIPGLALFYCGMVRKKNVLATMAQSFACTMLCSLL